MASANPETLAGGRLHLLSLPAELQTMIFDMAYQRDASSKLTTISNWKYNQNDRLQYLSLRGDPLPAIHEPYPKATEFMVSKQYFVSAARSYVGTSRVVFPDPIWYGAVGNLKVLTAFAQDVEANLERWSLVKAPNIKTLRLMVPARLFLGYRDRHGPGLDMLWRRLAPEEFSGSRAIEMVEHMRDTKHFELVGEHLDPWDYGKERIATWQANVKTLEGILEPIVTRPREEDDDDEYEREWTPLYFDSEVCWQKNSERNLLEHRLRKLKYGTLIRELAEFSKMDRARIRALTRNFLDPEGCFDERESFEENSDEERDFEEESDDEGDFELQRDEEDIAAEPKVALSAASKRGMASLEVPNTKAARTDSLVCENEETVNTRAKHYREMAARDEKADSEGTETAHRLQELEASLATAKAEIARFQESARGEQEPSGLQTACKILIILFLLWVAWWLVEFYIEMEAEARIFGRANAGLQIPASRYCRLMVN